MFIFIVMLMFFCIIRYNYIVIFRYRAVQVVLRGYVHLIYLQRPGR